MIDDRIRTLDDRTARHLLATVASPHLRARFSETPPAADLREALTDTFGPAPASAAPTEGDLARAALLLLAEDPAMETAITTLLDSSSPGIFSIAETVGVITAALVILQIHVRIERSPVGKWKLLFEKKSTSDALLKSLAHGLLKHLPGGDTKTPPQLGS